MTEKPEMKSAADETEFSRQVGEKAARKLKAQRHATQTVWSGLGMMGLVGWSVTVPTLLGTALGLWLDRHYPGNHSWTLMLLAIGLGLGCLNAWHWVAREVREIHDQEENNHE
ncbi:putative F0F1-ATPase subunit [mine drainage metagenome]|uniref:Putative F0F1-ATPase subunit n=1 Tax=mine drainage metagenome TaxID=410659 RepID=A0A1J5PZK2_9ZZZZ